MFFKDMKEFLKGIKNAFKDKEAPQTLKK